MTTRLRNIGLWLLALAGVAGCGAGSSNSGDPPFLPQLQMSVPTRGETGQAIGFSSSAPTNAGLQFRWDFGDGQVSSDAEPSHTYTRGGEFQVSLTVSNAQNQQQQRSVTITVDRLAHLAGLGCTLPGQRGWCLASAAPIGWRIGHWSFASDQVAWAVGSQGRVARTTDGGISWKASTTLPVPELVFVTAVSAEAATAVGVEVDDTLSLWSTRNAGLDWQRLATPARRSAFGYQLERTAVGQLLTVTLACTVQGGCLYDRYFLQDGGDQWTILPFKRRVFMAGSGTLWRHQNDASPLAGGPRGSLLRSTDLGVTWSSALTFDPELPVPFRLFAERTVVAFEEFGEPDPQSTTADSTRLRVHRSTDDGVTWTQSRAQGLASTPFANTPFGHTPVLQWISGNAQGELLVRWNGILMRSADWGGVWTPVDSPAGLGAMELYDRGGWVVALDPAGASTPWISRDMGATWRAMPALPGGTAAPGLVRAGATQLMVVDDPQGRVWSSAQGVAAWRLMLPSADWAEAWDARSTSASSILPLTIWALSPERVLAQAAGRPLRLSIDGGRTWQAKPVQGADVRWDGLWFANDRVGWLLGVDGALWNSRDGGDTWSLRPNVGKVSAIAARDEQALWGVVGGTVRSSADGGTTWTALGDLPFSISDDRVVLLQRLTEQEAVLMMNDRIAVTRDGGQTWQERPSGINEVLMAMTAVDAKTVWALGLAGAVIRSGDAGATWSRVENLPGAPNQWRAVHFVDALRGWIVGAGGRIVATRDGGTSWQEQLSGTPENLMRIQFLDGRSAIVYGDRGTVLLTGNGGG
jgi:photosystem II stability/assembly factor-like uncharacterized protein